MCNNRRRSISTSRGNNARWGFTAARCDISATKSTAKPGISTAGCGAETRSKNNAVVVANRWGSVAACAKAPRIRFHVSHISKPNISGCMGPRLATAVRASRCKRSHVVVCRGSANNAARTRATACTAWPTNCGSLATATTVAKSFDNAATSFFERRSRSSCKRNTTSPTSAFA